MARVMRWAWLSAMAISCRRWPAAAQQPVENLAEDQRRQHRDVARAVQQMDQAQHRIQQAGVDTVDVEAAVAAPAGHFHGPGVGDQLGDFRRVDIQPDAEVGRVRRGVDHLAGQRQGDRDHQVVQRIVDIAFLGQLHLLAALGDDAQGRFVHAARRQGGAVGADQGEVRRRCRRYRRGAMPEQRLRQFALALAQFGGEIDGKKRGIFAHAGTRGETFPRLARVAATGIHRAARWQDQASIRQEQASQLVSPGASG